MNSREALGANISTVRRAPNTNSTQANPTTFSLSLVFALTVITCCIRFPLRMRLGFLWAEDGLIFMKAAYEHGLHSLLEGYAGYFVFDIRLVSYLVARTSSVEGMAFVLPWACVCIYGLMAMYLYRVSLRVTGDLWWQRPIALLMALIPVLSASTGEPFISITNLQWLIAPTAFACLLEVLSLRDPQELTRSQVALRAAFLFTSAVTGPFSIVFSAVGAIWYLATWRRRRGLYIQATLALYGFGAALQVFAILTLPQFQLDHPAGQFSGFPWIREYLNYFILEIFYPGNLDQLRAHGYLVAALATAAVMATAVFTPKWRVTVAMLVVGSIFWVLGVHRASTPDVHLAWSGYGSRYLTVPLILFAWALAISLATAHSRFIKALSAVGLVLMLMVSATQFKTVLWNADHWRVIRKELNVFEVKVVPETTPTTITDLMHHGE